MLKVKEKKNKISDQAGFTLIEMMVAVSIFVIVAFIVVSTLLTMSYAYKKAQKMRLIMDNFNFALQAMSLGIREGINYDTPSFCSFGSKDYSNCFKFKPIDPGSPYVCYSLNNNSSDRGFIERCEGICPCDGSGSRFTSPDINVITLGFLKEQGSTGRKRNKVRIIISGEAGRGRELTDFFIQNTVSQRNPNY